MKVKIFTTGPDGSALPIVSTSDILLGAGCQTAAALTTLEMNAIKLAAGSNYDCFQSPNVPCVDAVEGNVTNWAFHSKQPGVPCGFLLAKFSGADKVYVGSHITGTGTCVPKSVLVNTNAGNTAGVDLLPQYLVQVKPNGFHGNVTFRVYHHLGGTNPRTIIVNTTSFGSDLAGLQNAIATGFSGQGFPATVANAGSSYFPSDFIPGGLGVSGTQMPASPLVKISTASADSIECTAVPGADVTQEMNVPISPSAPGVSPWGMVLLFGVLLLAGSWILQRRHRLAMMG